jgi:DNA-binding response OmpR family regulator
MERALETSWGGNRQGRYLGEDRQDCLCPLCGSALAAWSIGFEAGLVVANGGSVQLTKTEGAVFGRLLKSFRGFVRKESLYHEVVSAKYAEADWPSEKVIDVYICHLRRKLCEVGLKIETRVGYGWRLVEAAEAVG